MDLSTIELTLVEAKVCKAAHLKLSDRLVFNHIPKAAGTTIETILQACGLLDGRTHYRAWGTIYKQYLGSEKPDALHGLLDAGRRQAAEANILTGHVPYGVHRHLGCEVRYLTMLRDPVERFVSHFTFGVQRGGWSAAVPLQRLVSIGKLVDNPQLRQLAGDETGQQACDDSMLDLAIENLGKHYYLAGTVCRADEFISQLQKRAGWPSILYSRRMPTLARLPAGEIARISDEAENLVGRERKLYEQLVAMQPEQPLLKQISMEQYLDEYSHAASSKMLVLSRELTPPGRNYPVVPAEQKGASLQELEAAGVKLKILVPHAQDTVS